MTDEQAPVDEIKVPPVDAIDEVPPVDAAVDTPPDEVPAEDPPPVVTPPTEAPLDGIALLEAMADAVGKLKTQEKDQLALIASLQKQVSDAGLGSVPVGGDTPSDKTYSQAELDAKLAEKDAASANALAMQKADYDGQVSALTARVQAVKDAAKAAIAKVKDADDEAATEAGAGIDAL